MFQLQGFLGPLYLDIAGGLVEFYFLFVNFDHILIDNGLHLIFLQLTVVDKISINNISKILFLILEPHGNVFAAVHIILIIGRKR